MSQPKPAAGSAWGCRTPGCLVGVFAVVFLFLLGTGLAQGLFELGWALLFGWTQFISRVIPRITWNWAALITGTVIAGLLAVSAHFFLTWLTREIALARGVSFQWQRKWTASGLLLLAFCFLTGMSFAGAAHQIGWIMASNESLFVDRYLSYRRIEAMQVEMATRQALLKPTTLPELRTNLPTLLNYPQRKGRPSPLESVQLLVSLTPTNTVAGVLIIAIEKKSETRYGAKYLTANDSTAISPKDLPGFIQLNATNLVAF